MESGVSELTKKIDLQQNMNCSHPTNLFGHSSDDEESKSSFSSAEVLLLPKILPQNNASAESKLQQSQSGPNCSNRIKEGNGKKSNENTKNSKQMRRYKEQWLMMYEELKKYKLKHGNTQVPIKYAENFQLRDWVRNQRMQYRLYSNRSLQTVGKRCHMNEERIEMLELIGFEWDNITETKQRAKPGRINRVKVISKELETARDCEKTSQKNDLRHCVNLTKFDDGSSDLRPKIQLEGKVNHNAKPAVLPERPPVSHDVKAKSLGTEHISACRSDSDRVRLPVMMVDREVLLQFEISSDEESITDMIIKFSKSYSKNCCIKSKYINGKCLCVRSGLYCSDECVYKDCDNKKRHGLDGKPGISFKKKKTTSASTSCAVSVVKSDERSGRRVAKSKTNYGLGSSSRPRKRKVAESNNPPSGPPVTFINRVSSRPIPLSNVEKSGKHECNIGNGKKGATSKIQRINISSIDGGNPKIAQDVDESKIVLPDLQLSYNQSWKRMFTELKDHVTTYGIFSIHDNDALFNGTTKQPLVSTFRLRNWLRFQWKQYQLFQEGQDSTLTKEKVKLLKSCGFLVTRIPNMKIAAKPFQRREKYEHAFALFKGKGEKHFLDIDEEFPRLNDGARIRGDKEKGFISRGESGLSHASLGGCAVPKCEKHLFSVANELVQKPAGGAFDIVNVGKNESSRNGWDLAEKLCSTNRQSENPFGNNVDEDSSDHDDSDDASFTLPQKFISSGNKRNISNDDLGKRRSVRKNNNELSKVKNPKESTSGESKKGQIPKNTKIVQRSELRRKKCKNNHEQSWLTKFNQLLEFKAKNGHCNLPRSYSGDFQLRDWVGSQRQQYNRMKRGVPSLMTSQRIEMLEAEGFVFEKGPTAPAASGDISMLVKRNILR